MHRWLQVTAEKAKLYEETGLLHPGRGYFYEASNSIKMVELYIDEIPENIIRSKNGKAITYQNIATVPFWRQPQCPDGQNGKAFISFGHDESIFWQFIFTGKAWKGTMGELAMIPKDEGTEFWFQQYKAESLVLVWNLPRTSKTS